MRVRIYAMRSLQGVFPLTLLGLALAASARAEVDANSLRLTRGLSDVGYHV